MLEDIFRLNDKVIVVTGASGLLGEKHAEAIACYGGTPVLIDLSEDKINKIVEQLNEKYNVNSMGYVVDVTDEEAVKKNVSEVIQKYGKIDGLINNAANNPKVEDSENINFSRLENFPENVWNDDLDVGLKGAFLCAKHYGYEISKNPKGGSILNISSDLGLIAPDQDLYLVEGLPPEKQAVKPVTYSVVKTGIIGLTRYLATYWSKNLSLIHI